jgi:hypothetical protein
MSNRRKTRKLNAGRLTRPRVLWTGRPRGGAGRRAPGRLAPTLQLAPPPTLMTNIRRVLASSKMSDR